jgi:hypothetical protein
MDLTHLFNDASDDSDVTQDTTQKRKYVRTNDAPKSSARKERQKIHTKTTVADIRRTIPLHCCDARCSAKFTTSDIQSFRIWFHSCERESRSEDDKTSLLKEIIAKAVVLPADSQNRKKTVYSIGNEESAASELCAMSVKALLGVSKAKWGKVKKSEEQSMLQMSLPERAVEREKEECVSDFLQGIREEYAPSQQQLSQVLPSHFTISEMHGMLKKRKPDCDVSIAYFVTIWKVIVLEMYLW